MIIIGIFRARLPSFRRLKRWKLSSALLGIANNLTNPNDFNLK